MLPPEQLAMYERRFGMYRHDFVALVIWATATAALIQAASSSEGPANTGTHGAISTPDLSGTWTKPYLGWELPLSGPGPVTNKVRRKQIFDIDGRPWPTATAPLVNTASQLIGDYSNPILKPAAAQEVKRRGESELHGMPNASARNQCWPEGVPAIFRDMTIAMLPQPDKITILYDYDHAARRVRMNQTWRQRGTGFIGGGGDSGALPDPNYRGKGLQLQLAVEDDGVFTTPWSATITYRRAVGAIGESVCAENPRGTYVAKDGAVPPAGKADF
jgi:hypothetical protein